MDDTPLGSFLLPAGFHRPAATALLREMTVVPEAGRFARRVAEERRLLRRRAYAVRPAHRSGQPVVLVPGFLAGDTTLLGMARSLRRRGFRTYRSLIHANVACTLDAVDALERRVAEVAERRGDRVQVVGHSLGGMLARGLAVRRPDLVSGVVTMGSPMLAPAAHHPLLSLGIGALVGMNRLGVRGVMSADCVAGGCARESFEESRQPMPPGLGFTALYSRRDGIVDWRACIDPQAVAVEVRASHVGMALDPAVVDHVAAALRRHEAEAVATSTRIA